MHQPTAIYRSSERTQLEWLLSAVLCSIVSAVSRLHACIPQIEIMRKYTYIDEGKDHQISLNIFTGKNMAVANHLTYARHLKYDGTNV